MDAHLDTDLVSRFLKRVEEADADFDGLKGLRDLFGALQLASGGLAYSEATGSQSVLWNAPDHRIVECSKELTRECRHPTIRIAASRQYPFALYDFEAEYAHDRCASRLIQQFKQTGLDNTYAVPVRSVGSRLHVFVIGKKGRGLSTEALLALQAACQGAVGKLTTAQASSPYGRTPATIADPGPARSRAVEAPGTCPAMGNIVPLPGRAKVSAARNVHTTAPRAARSAMPPAEASSEVAVLLSVLDHLWEKYDAASEANDRDLMSMLSAELLATARRIDESSGLLLVMHLNDNAVRH